MQAILYGAMLATATAALTVTAAIAAESVTGPDTGFFNGNDVHKFCDQNIMLGYAAGLWDQMTHSAFVFEVVPRSGPPQMVKAEIEYGRQLLGVFCPPDRVTVQQATDVFCKYVRDAPEKRHIAGALLFNEAMTSTWPCRK
jgi:hypothetical protein